MFGHEKILENRVSSLNQRLSVGCLEIVGVMMPQLKKLGGVERIIKATAFSASGLRAAWVNEAAFRQECALVVVLIPIAFWIGSSAVERALLIGSCLLVLVVELINSAIEASIDRIGVEQHPLSRRAKDLGSAAVMMTLALTATVWLLIGLERFV